MNFDPAGFDINFILWLLTEVNKKGLPLFFKNNSNPVLIHISRESICPSQNFRKIPLKGKRAPAG